MSRQSKEGLYYFPLDTDFFQNRKIFNLNKKFPSVGPIVLLRLYCDIYRERGYYLYLDQDYFEYFSDQSGVDEEEFFNILNYLGERNLMNIRSVNGVEQDIIASDDIQLHSQTFKYSSKHLPVILTSTAIQQQFSDSNKSTRHIKEVDPSIWALEIDDSNKFIRLKSETNYPKMQPFNAQLDTLLNRNSDKKISKDQNSINNCNNGGKLEKSDHCNELNQNATECNQMQSNADKCKEMNLCQHKIKLNKIKLNKNKYIEPPPEEDGSKDDKSSVSMNEEKKDIRKKNNNYKSVTDYKDKSVYGLFKNVYLKDKELEKLKSNYPEYWEQIIETLSSYKASSGKGYKSDYAAICNWVAKKVGGEYEQMKKKLNKSNQNNDGEFFMKVASGEINLN